MREGEGRERKGGKGRARKEVEGREKRRERRKEGERDRLKGGRRGGRRGRGQVKRKEGRCKVMGVSWSKTAWWYVTMQQCLLFSWCRLMVSKVILLPVDNWRLVGGRLLNRRH